ncbi:thiamine phosphate synthase [Candidatus Woesearchaeota archaeon]|nr:thiamine phosphate synthase [Candidatus Woesearchaeota archaeon]
MRPRLSDIDLYFITDSRLTRKGIIEDVKSAIRAGARIIQYREKDKPTRVMVKEAAAIRELCRDRAIFLVNDRVDVALAAGADGVHLGQDDMPYSYARPFFDKGMIGITVHDAEEAADAEKMGADYVGVSPIFETRTKEDAGKAAGLGLIREVKEKVRIPIVAIGGISLDNVSDVRKAGAKSAAVISAILKSDDVEEECRKFIGLISRGRAEPDNHV